METQKQKPNKALIIPIAGLALVAYGAFNGTGAQKEYCHEVTALDKETASELVDRTAKHLPGESTQADVNKATGGDYSKNISQGEKYKVCSTEDGHLSLNRLD